MRKNKRMGSRKYAFHMPSAVIISGDVNIEMALAAKKRIIRYRGGDL